jgi:hypothetical protein
MEVWLQYHKSRSMLRCWSTGSHGGTAQRTIPQYAGTRTNLLVFFRIWPPIFWCFGPKTDPTMPRASELGDKKVKQKKAVIKKTTRCLLPFSFYDRPTRWGQKNRAGHREAGSLPGYLRYGSASGGRNYHPSIPDSRPHARLFTFLRALGPATGMPEYEHGCSL